jgi:hypothetical protein
MQQKTAVTVVPSPTSTVTVTPDPTADWQTYTNNKFGFSFKYPDNWSLPVEEVIATNSMPVAQQITFGDLLIIEAKDEKYGSPYTLEDLPLEPQTTPINIGTDNFKALKTTDVSGNIVVYLSQSLTSTKVLSFNYHQELTDIVDQILSTFRFIDSSNSPDSLEWKTFTHPQFTFKYPGDWSAPKDMSSSHLGFTSGSKTFDIYINATMGRVCGEVVSGKILTISGIVAKQAIWRGVDCDTQKLSSIFTSLDKNEDHYAIEYVFDSKAETAEAATLDQILSTLTFVN